jgi:hypothetical protein
MPSDDYDPLPEDARDENDRRDRGGSKSRRDRSRSRDRWAMQQHLLSSNSKCCSGMPVCMGLACVAHDFGLVCRRPKKEHKRRDRSRSREKRR